MENRIKILRCRKILTPRQTINKGLIIIRGGRIESLNEEYLSSVPSIAEIIDCSDLIALPGFIDVHFHGWGGNDFHSDFEKSLEGISKLLPSFGVTGYLLTVSDVSTEGMLDILKRASHYGSSAGAGFLGLHLEGPFLNPARKGAMRLGRLCRPDIPLLERYLARGRDVIKMMTLSPELDGAMAAVSCLKSHGVIPCAGHSQADYAVAVNAFEKGVSHATHVFNAMAAFHHRRPGLLGAVLTEDSVTAEMIPDGVHLHPAAVKLLYRAKGADGLITVTDAHPLAGMEPGSYVGACDERIEVTENYVGLDDGTLAGGATPMNTLVKNFMNYAEIDLSAALPSATINPARLLGVEKERGELRAGMRADITLADSDLNVRLTMVNGEIVYRSPSG